MGAGFCNDVRRGTRKQISTDVPMFPEVRFSLIFSSKVFWDIFGSFFSLSCRQDCEDRCSHALQPLLCGFKRVMPFAALEGLFARYIGTDWSHKHNRSGKKVYILPDQEVGIAFVQSVDRDWSHTDCKKCTTVVRMSGKDLIASCSHLRLHGRKCPLQVRSCSHRKDAYLHLHSHVHH